MDKTTIELLGGVLTGKGVGGTSGGRCRCRHTGKRCGGTDESPRRSMCGTLAADEGGYRAMTDLHWLSATDTAHAIASRDLSPVELMTALLTRIGRLDPKLNAFIRIDAEAAMNAAKAAEVEMEAERPRGPLHGVPVGIKDIIDVAGLPTTCHSKVLIGNIAAADAVCVSRLPWRRRDRVGQALDP
jgi:hypothetical protein